MENKKISTEEFIEKSKSVWGGSTFDYSKVEYKNANTKVTLICKKHGIEFEQTPNNHLHGQNCPKCSKRKKNNLVC